MTNKKKLPNPNTLLFPALNLVLRTVADSETGPIRHFTRYLDEQSQDKVCNSEHEVFEAVSEGGYFGIGYKENTVAEYLKEDAKMDLNLVFLKNVETKIDTTLLFTKDNPNLKMFTRG